MQPSLTRRDLRAAATPQALARGQELAADVEDLDWDEHSIWGSLPGEGIAAGDLMITTAICRSPGNARHAGAAGPRDYAPAWQQSRWPSPATTRNSPGG